MRRIVFAASVVLTTTVFNFWIMMTIMPRHTSAGSGTPAAGDVNGDGLVDIVDPVYLFEYLFQSGPEPVACAGGGVLTIAQQEDLVSFLDGTKNLTATMISSFDIPFDPALTLIPFDTEANDFNDEFDVSASVFSPASDGTYLLATQLTFLTDSSTPVTNLVAVLYRNGSQAAISYETTDGVAQTCTVTLTTTIDLLAGDTVDLRANIGGGSPISLSSASQVTFLKITRVR